MICKTCNCEKIEMKTNTKCLDCHRKHRAEYMREFNSKPENKEKKNKRHNEYYHENKEQIRAKANEEYKTNPEKKEKKRKQDANYYEKVKNDPEKKAHRNELNRKSYKKQIQDPEKRLRMSDNANRSNKRHRDRINKYVKNKKQTDESFRIAHNLRCYVKRILKTVDKDNKFKSYVNKEAAEAIIKKIGPRPSEDHHLDHIICLSYFDLTIERHRKLANSPENLQWLTSFENLSKNNTLDFQQIYCSLSLTCIAKELGILF